jgi:DNA-directed RNA polymerase subunit K/omega
MNLKTIEDFTDIMSRYDPTKNKTKNILTKYEKVKIICIRIEQLQRGAQANVPIDPSKTFDPREIAHEEFRQHKLPMMVCRRLPDGTKEYWRLENLISL